jgi:ATP-dependent RNA helicase DeaD
MIFCNTIDSCRAAAYHLEGEDKEHADKFVSYHGELNSAEREANLQKFRDGESQFLVCTDLAARGLDIPSVSLILSRSWSRNSIY